MTAEERRAADQAEAEGRAFAAGVLPEEDRRAVVSVSEIPEGGHETVVVEEPPAVLASEHVKPQVADVLDAIEKAQPGSIFTRTAIGWDVKWVDGGTVVHVQGATITEALGSHGAQIIRIT